MENIIQSSGISPPVAELLKILTWDRGFESTDEIVPHSAKKRIVVAGFRNYLSGGMIDFFRGYASVAWDFRDSVDVVWAVHPEATIVNVLKNANTEEYPTEFDIDLDWDFFETFDKVVFWDHLPEVLGIMLHRKPTLNIHAPIIGRLRHAHGSAWFHEIADRFFELKDELKSQHDDFFETVTKGTPYKLLHCRVGDIWMFKDEPDRQRFMYDPFCEKFRQTVKRLADPDTVLVSDCIELKTWAAETGLPFRGISNSIPVHATTHDDTGDAFGIVKDISLIRHATEVHTVAPKSSGFSGTLASFLGIPLQLHLI